MSFSLPVSLPLPHNFRGERQQELNEFQTAVKVEKKTIKRDGKLVQSDCNTWEVLYMHIAQTHTTIRCRTRSHSKNHDMQIRYKIYIIFMHCMQTWSTIK